MARFVENGDFHDIVIKFDKKTYKLHRFKLLSESGYFSHVFSAKICEATHQPNKYEEYSLDVRGIDPATFELSIKYIYFDKIDLSNDVIIRVLKAAGILKIDKLLNECESWIKHNVDTISFEAVLEILDFIHRNENLKFEYVHRLLLCKRILAVWSEIEDVSSFCAISIDTLEDLLISSVLHVIPDSSSLPSDFGVGESDDQHKLLDICSRWIMYDVKNRYELIPRTALALNCNHMLRCVGYKMETVLDWSNCSQQFVRDKLLEMLSSTSLIARETLLENGTREFKDEPVFVASEGQNKIRILNSNLDEIASICFFKKANIAYYFSVSAAKIGDNLFIASTFSKFLDRICFLAYNISSKKFTSLAFVPEPMEYKGFVVLNCYDDVYCCFENGSVWKYSIRLNRWMRFLHAETDKKYVQFTSDGKLLYRMYETEKITGNILRFDVYNFINKSWKSLSLTIRSEYDLIGLIIINRRELGVLSKSEIRVTDEHFQRWRCLRLPTPLEYISTKFLTTIAQCEDGMLCVRNNKLFQLSTDRDWQLKNEIPLQPTYHEFDVHFGTVSSIHRPTACRNVRYV